MVNSTLANLYLHKIVRPGLKNLHFPSTNFAEGETEVSRGCLNYGEAASAISIDTDRGHLFKKFYRGFDGDTLNWMPYEDDESELTLPFSFRFETGCSNAIATAIFNCIIKPRVLPAEFRHGRGKMGSGTHASDNLPTYEFYNPNFVARQFGLGQLPP